MAADWSGDLEQVSSETGVSCIDSFLHSPNVSVDISASKEETFGNDSAAKTDDHNTNVIWIVGMDFYLLPKWLLCATPNSPYLVSVRT